MPSSSVKLRIVSWNIARSSKAWQMLSDDKSIDIALLQEATKPPKHISCETYPGPGEPWSTAGVRRSYCAAIARFSEQVSMSALPIGSLFEAGRRKIGASRLGTIAAAKLDILGQEQLIVVSWYGYWETAADGRTLYADASAHRLISDLSSLVASERNHKILVAGDLNVLYGYGEKKSRYWKLRYDTVFARMEAIGLPLAGPQFPNGIQANPWPEELPRDSKNLPTFRTRRLDPFSAARQLDFVFASKTLHPRLKIQALNKPSEWGPSDHCRIFIDLS